MDDEPLGKGTLTKLAELKAEHRETFKAAAPKRRKIGQICADLLCVHLIGRAGVGRDGLLRVAGKWCMEKRCPREKADDS